MSIFQKILTKFVIPNTTISSLGPQVSKSQFHILSLKGPISEHKYSINSETYSYHITCR